jgi:hypothetical protein
MVILESNGEETGPEVRRQRNETIRIFSSQISKNLPAA